MRLVNSVGLVLLFVLVSSFTESEYFFSHLEFQQIELCVPTFQQKYIQLTCLRLRFNFVLCTWLLFCSVHFWKKEGKNAQTTYLKRNQQRHQVTSLAPNNYESQLDQTSHRKAEAPKIQNLQPCIGKSWCMIIELDEGRESERKRAKEDEKEKLK